jgi:hypothetical protein
MGRLITNLSFLRRHCPVQVPTVGDGSPYGEATLSAWLPKLPCPYSVCDLRRPDDAEPKFRVPFVHCQTEMKKWS